MSVEQMNAILNDAHRWQSELPALSEEELLTAVSCLRCKPMPDDLLAFYRRTNGASIGNGFNLMIMPVDEVIELDEEDILHEDLPSSLIFARDHGSGILFADVDSSLGNGVGAIYFCDGASMMREDAIFCTASLSELIDLTTRGVQPWKIKNA